MWWRGDIQDPRSLTWLWKEVNRRAELRLGSAGLNLMCSLVEMPDKHLDVPVRVQALRRAGCAGLGASTAERWGLKSRGRMLPEEDMWGEKMRWPQGAA